MSDSYGLNASELSYASSVYGNGLSTAGSDNYSNTIMLHDIITSSEPVLTAEGWDAIRSSLTSYEDCLACAQTLNEVLDQATKEYLDSIQQFLAPDTDLDTSDLAKYEQEKADLEQEKLTLETRNAVLAETSPTISVFKGYDENGYPVYEEEVNPQYEIDQQAIVDNNTRITDVLEPAIAEAQRLIDKINTFQNEILPKLNARLDEVYQQVTEYMNKVDALAVTMPGSNGNKPTLSLLAVHSEAEANTPEDRMLYIYNQLRYGYGYNEAAAKAIIANMYQECPSFSATQQQDDNPNHPGYGLCQWESSAAGGSGRREQMEAWCAANGRDPNSIDGQLAWMNYEAQSLIPSGSDYDLWSRMHDTSTQYTDEEYKYLSEKFCLFYEGKPEGYGEGRAWAAQREGVLDTIDADTAASQVSA